MSATSDRPSQLEQSIESLLKQLKVGQRYAAPRPAGSGDAYFLSLMAQQSEHTIVVFCADPLQARRLVNEVKVFNPSLNCLHFPDWETLPYDSFSPHQEIISARLSALFYLQNAKQGIFILPF